MQKPRRAPEHKSTHNNLKEFSIGGSHETTCPHSTNKRVHTFVPALMVASSSSTWEGTHGPATPFMCKYLSPWAMYAQIHALVLRRKAFPVSIDSRFRKQHAELFWNLCMYVVFFCHEHMKLKYQDTTTTLLITTSRNNIRTSTQVHSPRQT